MKHKMTQASASISGDTRRISAPRKRGRSTVSIAPATYSANAPKCSSAAGMSPLRARSVSSRRFIVWALASVSLRQSMA